MQVFVRDNNVEQALRILKKKMQREGVFKEMRRARFYEKPSVRAVREKADAGSVPDALWSRRLLDVFSAIGQFTVQGTICISYSQ